MSTPAPLVMALKARLFGGFADASRLAIMDALREGPLAVGAIAEKTGLGQSNVSNHLRYLSANALVTATQQGRYTLYKLSNKRVAEMLDLADKMLHEAAHDVYEYTSRLQDDKRPKIKGDAE